MYVSKKQILDLLPPFQNKRVVVTDDQSVKDIISTMLSAHRQNAWLYDKIGFAFVGGTVDETCNNLFDFCYTNLKYDQEPDSQQTVQVPQGLLSQGHCDCKGFASFICGCLDAIKRSGAQKIDWEYCFASYDILKKSPYHVFAVVKPKTGAPIWIDPTPGANGKIPVWEICRTVKTSDMLENIIAGTDDSFKAVAGYAGKQPELRQAQSDKAASALSGLGLVSRYPQTAQTINPAPFPEKRIFPNRVRIGDVTTPTGTEPSLIQGISNKNLFIGVGTVAAVYMLTHQKVKVMGAVKKKNILPILAIAGIAGYFLYKKFTNPFGNDPELGDFKYIDGMINVAPGVRDGYDYRLRNFVPPPGNTHQYTAGDILNIGLPFYSSAIGKMTVDEQQALYSLINDHFADSLTSNSPLYNTLVAIKSKYKIPFY